MNRGVKTVPEGDRWTVVSGVWSVNEEWLRYHLHWWEW